MKCPKCFGQLETDGSCSCGYRVTRKQEQIQEQTAPSHCAWVSSSKGCSATGILSLSTAGGKFYCREHFEVLQHREPYGMGNELPPIPKSFAAQQWHVEMKQFRQQFPNWGQPQGRMANPLPREPGCDDE